MIVDWIDGFSLGKTTYQVYPLTSAYIQSLAGDRTYNIWISRSHDVLIRSFERRGLRWHRQKLVWKLGESREKVFDMYGDSHDKLWEILAIVIVWSRSPPYQPIRKASCQVYSLSTGLYIHSPSSALDRFILDLVHDSRCLTMTQYRWFDSCAIVTAL